MLRIEKFVCGALENNVYLLVAEDSHECAVVDPGMECGAVLRRIEKAGLIARYLLLTHAHFDHVFSVAEFKDSLGAEVVMHRDDLPMLERLVDSAAAWGFSNARPAPAPDIFVEHGQTLDLAGDSLEVRHTPGHSPGQVAYIFGGNAFVGDTLFWHGVGRWDLPGGDFELLKRSIEEQLFTLPGETVVWPGHGESTTIDTERRLNPYIGEGARFIPKL